MMQALFRVSTHNQLIPGIEGAGEGPFSGAGAGGGVPPKNAATVIAAMPRFCAISEKGSGPVAPKV